MHRHTRPRFHGKSRRYKHGKRGNQRVTLALTGERKNAETMTALALSLSRAAWFCLAACFLLVDAEGVVGQHADVREPGAEGGDILVPGIL